MICYLFLDEEGNLQRMDVKSSEAEDIQVPEPILGRWSRVVKRPEEEKKEAKRQAILSTEEIFLGLFAEGLAATEEQNTLKQLLALILERKRLLRSVGSVAREEQTYLHVKSKTEYRVPMKDLEPQQIAKIESQLDALVY